MLLFRGATSPVINSQDRKVAAKSFKACVHFFKGVKMEQDYFKAAIKESLKAEKKDSVPVGAVIVMDDKIIAKAHNINYRSKNVMDHAEIICIKKASRILKDWRLNDCDIYVTLEPCDMCKEVIKASRIKNVYYLIPKKVVVCKLQTNFCLVENYNSKLGEKKLKNFFKKIR